MKEAAVNFGTKVALRGIVTHPGDEDSGRPAVCFLNSGLVHHVGPHGFYVKAARDLAERGHLVLRMDFAGIGDSDKRKDNLRFERAAVEDAVVALDYLEKRFGAERFALAGLCSGAEISFKTAIQDERVVGAFLINAPQFAEEPTAELVSAVSEGKSAAYYWKVALFNKDSWRRVLSGRAEYGALVRAVGNKLGKAMGGGGRARRDAGADLEAFERLVGRDCKLRLLFSEVDWGYEYLQAILGKRIEGWRQGGNPHLHVLQGVDHMMTPLASQARARELVRAWAEGLPRG